ncbi:hypothetical protein BST96_13565 [Oceanicoccus sagamiensis]|uniref:Uncharacterized protein n=2 Tax=Oceanicoccus sagamiensis TaxID=716816 RepID=A0A1X9NAH4_9GAMM|nr:hypothetical protein BST96_13565 [Oceanicoccus sagamiensis]
MLVGLLVSISSQAALLSQDDSVWGVGSLTLDQTTGLQWLDLNLSTNFSFNAMVAEQSEGGLYEGFRYATSSEVETLFVHAGIPEVNASSAANTASAQALISLMGGTKTFRNTVEIFAITGSSNPTGLNSAIIDHAFNDGVAFYDVNTATGPIYGADYSDASIGSWLVADAITPVPVPAAWLFFSSALVLLGGIKRHQ